MMIGACCFRSADTKTDGGVDLNPLEDLSLLITAFFASLFGQGGGVLYTPLQIWSGINFNTAASTSLFLILVTSISSTIVYRRAHKVDWKLALAMEGPTTVGSFVGGVLSHYVSSLMLGLILSSLMGAASWFMLHPPQMAARPSLGSSRSRWVWRHMWSGKTTAMDLRLMIVFMLTIGLLTGMVGIGGGALKVPLMVLLFNVPLTIAIGSSAFMVGVTAAAGLLGHISMGHFDWISAFLLALPVFIGSQIGSRLSIRLNAQRLNKWFGAFILLAALISALHTIRSV